MPERLHAVIPSALYLYQYTWSASYTPRRRSCTTRDGAAVEDNVRKSNDRVLGAIRRNPRIIARFWSQVDRSEDENACWEWRGWCGRNGQPAFNVAQSRISPARVAWLLTTGEWPLGGRIHRQCGSPLCIRPSHLVWTVGSIMERRLSAESEGYLQISGVRVFVVNPSGDWRRTGRVTGMPRWSDSA